MIKYTPHTQAAVSVAERNEKIQSMHNELNTLFSSLQEILPVGRLMLQYSQANSKQIRMKEQINFLTKVLEDLHQPNTRFSNDTNDQIYDFFHEQAMINNNYTNKLFKRINKAEIDNITHTINFKLTQINSESDLNQEAADEILFSYIEKVKTLNKEYEQQYCTNFEYNTYLKLIEEEEARYEKFKQETNDTIQNLQNEIDKKQNELQSHIRKLEKLKASEQKMVKDFAEKINMLKEVNDYLHEKANEFHDEKLLNALCELFSALQNPNSTDSEIKLILKSISHLANLKPVQNNEQIQQPPPQMQQQQPQMQQQQLQMQKQQLQMQKQQLQMQQPRIQPPPPMQHQQLSIDQLNALSIHDKLAILKQKFLENQKNFK